METISCVIRLCCILLLLINFESNNRISSLLAGGKPKIFPHIPLACSTGPNMRRKQSGGNCVQPQEETPRPSPTKRRKQGVEAARRGKPPRDYGQILPAQKPKLPAKPDPTERPAVDSSKPSNTNKNRGNNNKNWKLKEHCSSSHGYNGDRSKNPSISNGTKGKIVLQ